MAKFKYADEQQAALYKKFPSTHYLSNPTNLDHVYLWSTFFRRNLHRLAIDYLGIRLHLYQVIWMYLLGISDFLMTVAARSAAKSWIIGVYGCCRCISRPHTEFVVVSGTKGQARIIVNDKIKRNLVARYPVLEREIKRIYDNKDQSIVEFHNGSVLYVVPASENARGGRSCVLERDECRQIDKFIDDSVLSPYQVIRQAPYLTVAPYNKMVEEIQEEPVDIYTTSSWMDSHWMWSLWDKNFESMLNGENRYVIAFDESIPLKHNIKTFKQLESERRKQDNLSWRTEFLNERIRENTDAFFDYALLYKAQKCKQPWYPIYNYDPTSKNKNPYAIPKQKGEIRAVCCDMAFVQDQKNDNSVFSCLRLLPETNRRGITSYKVLVCYMVAVQGGETLEQTLTIRRLFEDFESDFIVLDVRNAGLSILDALARVLYDDERNKEYTPLLCMNDEGLASRGGAEGAEPCVYAISASQKLNSDIAQNFRRMLVDGQIQLLVPFNVAQEDVLTRIPEYQKTTEINEQLFYERPFLETQALVAETCGLQYEKKEQTGLIVVREQGKNRKDRYTSVSYGCWFAKELERDNLVTNEQYEYTTFIN